MASLDNYKVCYLREKYCGVWNQEIFTEGLFEVKFLEPSQSSAIII